MKTFFLRFFTWWNGQTFGTQLWTWLYGEAVGQDRHIGRPDRPDQHLRPVAQDGRQAVARGSPR